MPADSLHSQQVSCKTDFIFPDPTEISEPSYICQLSESLKILNGQKISTVFHVSVKSVVIYLEEVIDNKLSRMKFNLKNSIQPLQNFAKQVNCGPISQVPSTINLHRDLKIFYCVNTFSRTNKVIIFVGCLNLLDITCNYSQQYPDDLLDHTRAKQS